ncbi:MAG: hypothetical protein AAFV53_28170 [Myxococcota bacterium]
MGAEVGGGYTEHMRLHRRRRATYKDLFDLPRHQVGEIVDGSLYASPRPASRHARVSSMLGIGIGGPFDQGYGDEQIIHAPSFDAIPFDLCPLWGEAKKPGAEESVR